MQKKRTSGLVLPVFSLPSAQGIGSLGRGALQFIDFLSASGQTAWQVLPMGPTGFGNSPYQSCSSAAGNPLLIDLTALAEDDLLPLEEYSRLRQPFSPDAIDYETVTGLQSEALRAAFAHSHLRCQKQIVTFSRAQGHWLADYALFVSLRQALDGAPLSDWPHDLRARKPAALAKAKKDLAEEIAYHTFVQWLFFRQWKSVKEYAGQNGVSIIGDMPIYVAPDSVEVWTHPELFLLDADGRPAAVAGVPPDYYAEKGQHWGNPLYKWTEHKKNGYAWWIERLRHLQAFYDCVRVDHFRALYDYWEIPADAEDARAGRWRKGPGMPFARAVQKSLPALQIIAEDLGDLDDTVRAFLHKTGWPGMNVLIYAFSPGAGSLYLPHNTGHDRIFYTSTHDSPSFMEWYAQEASDEQRTYARQYMRLREEEGLSWGALQTVWASRAYLAMAPLQDVLALGADARVNIPGTVGPHNWSWRVRTEALNAEVSGRLRHITQLYGRL